VHFSRVAGLLLVSLLGACRTPAPAGPCMSDRECHADRICHEGRCRFVEDVRQELAARDAAVAAADPTQPALPPPDVGPAVGETPATAAHGGTTMFMGDARHTGRVPFAGPTRPVSARFTYRTGSRIYASPVVAPDGTVLIGSLDQSLTAITPEGTLRWRYSGTGKYYASALVTPQGDVIAGSVDGVLVALTALGQVRWQSKLSDGIDTSPVLDGDRVFVAADGLYAYDLKGNQLFRHTVGAHVRSAPAVHPGGIVVFGTPQGKVVALTRDGKLAWQADAGANIDGGAAISDDGHVVIGTDLGHVLCFDARGALVWRFETGDDVRATPAIAADGTILVGSYDRALYAIAPNGTLKWRFETGGRIRSSARIDPRGNIYFGSQDDFVYGLTPAGTLLFKHNVGRDVDSSPVIDARGTLLVGADDGNLYALN
jgi:outer membrane protein assembly factor BamB